MLFNEQLGTVATAETRSLYAAGGPGLPVTHAMLQIGPGWFPERKGGSENFYYNLLPELGRNGFCVHGIVPGSARVAMDSGGSVLSFGPTGLSQWQRGRAIRRTAAPFLPGADIVGAHFALYALPLLDRLRRQPLVCHFQGPWALESAAEGCGPVTRRAKQAIERLVYHRADRIIVLSEAFGAILREQYGIPGDRIRRVPGGVDCDRFAATVSQSEARRRLGWETDRPVLVTVRRLVRRMGIDNLIQAMTKLTGAGRDAVLYIVGTGPERAALQSSVAALGLDRRVRFAGALSDADLPLAYHAADMAVVPTHSLEGFGLIAAEALAAGTPVLVTPVGGLPEVVSGLSTALLLPGRDPCRDRGRPGLCACQSGAPTRRSRLRRLCPGSFRLERRRSPGSSRLSRTSLNSIS